jgi:hypothetical protein
MGLVGNSLRLPAFIEAPTPKELVRSMMRNNLQNGKEYDYFSISKNGNKWIAWYTKDYDLSEAMTGPRENR